MSTLPDRHGAEVMMLNRVTDQAVGVKGGQKVGQKRQRTIHFQIGCESDREIVLSMTRRLTSIYSMMHLLPAWPSSNECKSPAHHWCKFHTVANIALLLSHSIFRSSASAASISF